MVGELLISIGEWCFDSCADRFCLEGYRETVPFEKRFELVKKSKAHGIDVLYPRRESINEVKKIADSYGLKVAWISVNIYGERRWRKGSLSSSDEGLRKKAIDLVKDAMDAAKKCGSEGVNIWAGQDGYDYPFQVNYTRKWKWFVEALRDCADYRPEIKIAIESKICEPRAHLLIGTTSSSLLLTEDVGRKNVGVTIDTGHAYMAYESTAQMVALTLMKDRLLHMHLNDCFGRFDDDLIFGTVHFFESLEMLYWLRTMNYSGWYGFDIFPAREDPLVACSESVKNLKSMFDLTTSINVKILQEALRKEDFTKISPILRSLVLKRS